mmetsp:Transcript_30222/g.52319  ORF Transcript_30222/g.52319 Transcript_30222/m.52319 type:complete len:327 (-) Transcript_30222:64-1044(-)
MINIHKRIPIIQRGRRRIQPRSLTRKRLHLWRFIRRHCHIPSIPQQHRHQPRGNRSIHRISTPRHQSSNGFQHGPKIVLAAVTSDYQVERIVNIRAGTRHGIGRKLRRIQSHAQETKFALRFGPAALLVFEGGIGQHHARLVADLEDQASPYGAYAIPLRKGAILLIRNTSLLLPILSPHQRSRCTRHPRGIHTHQEQIIKFANLPPFLRQRRGAVMHIQYQLGNHPRGDAFAQPRGIDANETQARLIVLFGTQFETHAGPSLKLRRVPILVVFHGIAAVIVHHWGIAAPGVSISFECGSHSFDDVDDISSNLVCALETKQSEIPQ